MSAEWAIAAISAASSADGVGAAPIATGAVPHRASFADLLTHGLDRVEGKLVDANALANAFMLDDNIPVHQVTFALEEARLSLELALQVRNRLVDAYQQVMGMQL